MPVDYLQLMPQAKKLGKAEFARQQRKQQLLVIAMQQLRDKARDAQALSAEVEAQLARSRILPRCALSTTEALDGTFDPPDSCSNRIILAADGSQINPDRHDAFSIALINIAVITLTPGSQKAPLEKVTTRLEIPEPDENGASEALLALQRDTEERVLLAQACTKYPGCIALTDGPLELFHQPQQAQDFDRLFTQYLSALREMREIQSLPAGYVDKPRSSMVTRLLELSGDSACAGLSALDDAALFSALLGSGQRSAVFRMLSEPGKQYSGDLALHCFFLNAAAHGATWIARIEIPAWVADNAQAVSDLHATLLEQCRLSASHPYPYLLHRAHETALVSLQEKNEIVRLACSNVLTEGGILGEESSKQSMKNLSRRTRYAP